MQQHNSGYNAMRLELQEEVDKNYEVFARLLPSLIPRYSGKYALMKSGKVLGYYSSALDARTAAESFIDDKLYSIQRVTDSPVDLGYFSHALYSCPVQP
jgi:hypothetical protein